MISVCLPGIVLTALLAENALSDAEEWKRINEDRPYRERPHCNYEVHPAPLEKLTLVPYGCTNLRIAEFPVLGAED